MIRAPLTLVVPAAFLAAAACAERPAPVSPAEAVLAGPGFHVGYKGDAVGLGMVVNDAECHIGKRGLRWPPAEQWEVKVFDAHLVVSASGVISLFCEGVMPPTKANGEPLIPPSFAEVEKNVLCFLPSDPVTGAARETRHAMEVFTPSGRVILRCHYNPRGR